VRLNRHDYHEVTVLGHPGYAALRELLLGPEEAHMYLTYHLIYPPGTRIITLSQKSPLPLLYKEMAPLAISVDQSGMAAAPEGRTASRHAAGDRRSAAGDPGFRTGDRRSEDHAGAGRAVLQPTCSKPTGVRLQAFTDTALPVELWVVVILLGALAIASCFLLRVDTFALHATITMLVAAPISLVLYFIAVSDHPFQGGISVSAEPYRAVFEKLMVTDPARQK
jgi:hypothetical protein